MTTRSIGAELIMRERQRQLAAPPQGEGWTPEHDDEHEQGELARAAACYAVASVWDVKPGGADERLTAIQKVLVSLWPVTWALTWWKPKDRESNLVRAGALCAAELDRLDREKKRAAQDERLRGDLRAEDPDRRPEPIEDPHVVQTG